MKQFGKMLSSMLSLLVVMNMFVDIGITAQALNGKKSGFSTNYSLGSDPGQNVANIAYAQKGKKAADFGYNADWCAYFAHDCAELAGQSSAVPNQPWVPNLPKDLEKAGAVPVTSSSARPGDIILFDRNYSGDPEHVEIVYKVTNGQVYSIGGNTGTYNYKTSSVCNPRVNPNHVYAIYRPNYKGGSVPPTPDPGVYPEPTRNLSVTSPYTTGNDVKWVQDMLCKLGYSTTIDGIYGNGTKNKVIEFQKDNGLTADGIVGVNTRNKMKEKLNNAQKPKSGKVSVDKEIYSIGENITFKFTSDGGTSYTIGIDDESGKRIETRSTTASSYTRSFDKGGKYSAYISIYNNYGFIDSARIYFVVSPFGNKYNDYGSNFYAFIVHPQSGRYVERNSDRNVQLAASNDNNSKYHIWHFVKQSNGTYNIFNLSNNECIDVAGGNTSNGTNIGTYPSNSTAAQAFYLCDSTNGTNIVSSINKNKVLDVTGGATGAYTNIQLYDANLSAAQGFKIQKIEGSITITAFCSTKSSINDAKASKISSSSVYNDLYFWYELYYTSTGTRVDIIGGKNYNVSMELFTPENVSIDKKTFKTDNNYIKTNPNLAGDYYCKYVVTGDINISVLTRKHTINYKYTDLGTNFYAYISNPKSGKYVTANESNNNVYLNSSTGKMNQIWKFERQSDSSYKIINSSNQKCLDVFNAKNENGVNIQICQDNGNNAQRWYFVKYGDGYVLHSKCALTKALDISGGNTTDGTNIQLWATNNGQYQCFNVKSFNSKPNNVKINSDKSKYEIGNSAKLTWNNAAFANSYIVDIWYNNGINSTKIKSFETKDTNYILQNVQPGKYGVYVTAKNSIGQTTSELCNFYVDYIITYDYNDGTGKKTTQKKPFDSSVVINTDIPSREGYSFIGWSSDKNATTAQYQPGSKYTANNGATLYAVWKAKQITVTFYRNLNSSDNITSVQTFTYGVGGQSFSNKGWTKEGYTLLGWSFDRNATTSSYGVLSGVANDWINNNSPSKNLYAVWQRIDENLGTYKYANPNKTTLYAMISYGETNKYLTNQSSDYKNDNSYKNVDLRSKNDSLQQVWEFEKLSDGGYKISSVYDGRILDIFNTKTDNGTNIGACGTYYANGGQIWYLVKKDGKYVIQPKVSANVYLGAANSNDGGNIQVTTTSNLFNIEILKPVGKSTLNIVQEGTSGTPTKFTWTTATDATWYNLYIYDGEVWKSNCIYSQKNIKTLEWSTQLKPGTYQAHLSPLNIHNWTNSNIVSFTVQADNYTISYDMNEGTGSINSQTKFKGQDITISDIVPTRPDYLFLGWNTDKNATTAQYKSNDKYTDDKSITLYAVWKVNHDYTTKVIAPTCTEQGYTLHTCTNCGDSYKDTYTAAVGHKYTESVIAPTESAQGYTLHTCSVCGDSYKDNYTDVLKPDDPNAPQIVVDNKTIGSGKEVIVSVSLKNNPGIMALKFNVSYDSNVMTMVNAESVGINALYSQNITDNPFIVSWESGDHDIDTNGEIVKLTFMVNENANEGTYPITITYDEDNIYNLKEENIHFDVVNGSVTVSEYLPGDINNDGKVNMKDLTRLHQYINGWDVTVNESAKDVNGDGKVNMKDLTRLHQFINGWDVTIY